MNVQHSRGAIAEIPLTLTLCSELRLRSSWPLADSVPPQGERQGKQNGNAARYLNDKHYALRFGDSTATERRGYKETGTGRKRPGRRRLKNMRFCETNRIGFGAILRPTTTEQASCDGTAEKMNPVRFPGNELTSVDASYFAKATKDQTKAKVRHRESR